MIPGPARRGGRPRTLERLFTLYCHPPTTRACPAACVTRRKFNNHSFRHVETRWGNRGCLSKFGATCRLHRAVVVLCYAAFLHAAACSLFLLTETVSTGVLPCQPPWKAHRRSLACRDSRGQRSQRTAGHIHRHTAAVPVQSPPERHARPSEAGKPPEQQPPAGAPRAVSQARRRGAAWRFAQNIRTCTDRGSGKRRDLTPPVPQGVRAAAGSACAVQGGQPRQPAGVSALERSGKSVEAQGVGCRRRAVGGKARRKRHVLHLSFDLVPVHSPCAPAGSAVSCSSSMPRGRGGLCGLLASSRRRSGGGKVSRATKMRCAQCWPKQQL